MVAVTITSYFLWITFECPEQSHEAGSRVTLVMQARKPRWPGQLDPTAWALGPRAAASRRFFHPAVCRVDAHQAIR